MSTLGPLLLTVEDLRVRFEMPAGPVDALKGVNWSLYGGEILCIVGESGSGKTVMTHTLMGLVSTAPGVIGGHIRVHFDGEPVDLLEGLDGYITKRKFLKRERYHRKAGWQRLYQQRVKEHLLGRLGLIFQNPKNALDPLWNVGDQITESVRIARPDAGRREAREEALEWLRRVHIDRASQVAGLSPHELSGGMCQRVAIAQILALRTPVVIADEPTTGLDATIQAGILDLIKEVQREYGLSVLLITHDFGVVERLADRILVLFKGDQIQIGQAEDILRPGAQNHPYTAELLSNVRALEMGDLRAVSERY